LDTTWHAAGIVGPLRATYNMTQLTPRAVTVAGLPATATRLSFVGELGWEIAVRTADTIPSFCEKAEDPSPD
jgi:glycine cleavage system aminomethyltransferase T